MDIICSRTNPPITGVLVAEHLRASKNIKINIQWGDNNSLKSGNNVTTFATGNDLARILARLYDENELYGGDALEKTQVDHWLSLAASLKSPRVEPKDQLNNALQILNQAISASTFLVGKRLTIADFAVFSALCTLKSWQDSIQQRSAPAHVSRWYHFISQSTIALSSLGNLPEDVKSALKPSRDQVVSDKVGNRAREGKFVELPGAEMGKVVVRFPPEASGYLHIGHAKAALLNQYYQEAFQGKLVFRFDDTNPAKENVDFEKVILEDIKLLELKPDMFTHTSEYFDLMMQLCEKLLKEGKAYVDDTDAETMKSEREQKIESSNRNNDYDKNWRLWDEMKRGTELGQKNCVRAKIDMQSPNGCLRDPTIYRCKNEPHPRTGTKYRVYPTYDFACPIVDSIEGVTHVLRTMEYHDRDPQFFWFIDNLGLRKPHIWEYSRLAMTHTVLSKRKLTWFVQEGLVDGWDDPRMPTVRGVLRRGMTVQGLKEFIIAQGSSRSVVFMEWDKIWAFNKKVIDPVAPRYTALEGENPVLVKIKGVKVESFNAPLHPKDESIGTKEVWIGPEIYIDRVDVDSLIEGQNATFINWGNLIIKKIYRNKDGIDYIEAETNLDNKDYKKTPKLTWLAVTENAEFTPTICVYFDHLISKALLGKDEDFKQFINTNTKKEVRMLGDPELKKLKQGDIIQLQRRGFFRVDVAYGERSLYSCAVQPIVLFYVPDGTTKDVGLGSLNRTADAPSAKVANKVEAKKLALQSAAPSQSKTPKSINEQIITQGNLVRDLKTNKAPKPEIEEAVKALLALKSEYKALSKTDWKPGCVPPEMSPPSVETPQGNEELDGKIQQQGDKIRELKQAKSDKATLEPEIKLLLSLKQEYKQKYGKDWSPPSTTPVVAKAQEQKVDNELDKKIQQQGDKIRQLKADKVDKSTLEPEVKLLLSLKQEFKQKYGKDWSPASTTPVATKAQEQKGDDELDKKIQQQGDKIRQLKADKVDKSTLEPEVKLLLSLKQEFKQTFGKDWSPSGGGDAKPKSQPKPAERSKEKKPAKDKKPVQTPAQNTEESAGKKTRLGLEARKETHLSDWYSQVITKSEMIEYYDVSGCYIFRPWSYAIWESIKDWFDVEIKKLGVENCYFPIFVSRSVLEKEKTHIADFSPEVAWVTKSGDSDMAEPIAIRPTSETVMYPAYAKWIQSYRDLPIKLNQWNNVVRWEFKHPSPFLRTREFLWQEGHTAYAAKEEADVEVKTILDLYARIYTDILAIPVVKGRKTEKEKFAGGDYTLTVEAFISASGRAIQGATSHHLGQNFSKIFDIVYEDPDTQEKKYVWQNSWGLTTRTIGVMIMIHADNQGLVLPPRVASVQIVIVPCGITVNLDENSRKKLQKSCDDLEDELRLRSIKVKGDYRGNYSPGWKFNHWELKGVPIRIELGPKDIEKNTLVAVRRDTGEKLIIPRAEAAGKLAELLESIHSNLLQKATDDLEQHKILLKDWKSFTPNLDKKHIILAPFCGDEECEGRIKNDSTRDGDDAGELGAASMGAKSLCIPLEQPDVIKPADKCIHPQCTKKPLYYTLFGRSY